MTNQTESRKDYQTFEIAGTAIETWHDALYIDPSDLHAVDHLEVVTPAYRPYLLTINGNLQAFATEEQRKTYLDWRIKLAEKRSTK